MGIGDGQLRDFCRPLQLAPAATDTSARRGTLSFIGVGWQGFVRFATNAAVGRIGGPTALGLFSTASSTAQLCSLLGPTSAGSAASKYVAEYRGRNDTAQVQCIGAHLGRRTIQATCLLVIIITIAWTALGQGIVVDGFVVSALFAGYSGYSFTRGLQFGAGQVARATFWDIWTGLLGILGVIALLFLGARGLVLLSPIAGAYLLYSLINWPWTAGGRPSAQLRRELDRFVTMGIVGTLASAGFLQSSMLVARGVSDVATAGQYAAALTLATPGAMVASSVSLVLFPSMAHAWGRGDLPSFRRQTDHATRLLVLVMVAVFGTLVILGDFLVHLVWGASFSDAVAILPILLLAVLANSLSVACVNSITTQSARGMAISMRSSLVGALVGIVVWLVLAPAYSVLGVAIGYLAGTLVIAFIPVGIVWRRDGHRWGWLAGRVMIAVTIMLAVAILQHEAGISKYLSLPIAVIFLLMWLAMMLPELRILRNLVSGRSRGMSRG